MICLFCKKDSTNSKSVEHIIPESLGNKEHILPKGIVCDKCNQYFAIKLEKPLLEKPYFKNVRSRNMVESKKNNIPLGDAFVFGKKIDKVQFGFEDGSNFIVFEKEETLSRVLSKRKGSFIIQMNDEPEKDDLIVSRFLAKCALEFLITYIKDDFWLDEIINKKELDLLRNYARYGSGKFWKYNQRRIYKEEDRFTDHINHPEPYEILHEIEFLYLECQVMYFVIVIFGIEYVINLGGSELELYHDWLKNNNNISPVRRPSEKIIKRKL
ncbi:HNH endonuclease [Flavobacterium sp. NRK F10]|uniref:HNH endonuclease n=1 Tax=Flavobacterium sp. NRK F10 TaxID=2954931 RepID=UPI002091272C|nr:HNH endonuclease [Flavobacterium sp. NRK F10]MCO6175863.1 HNH endonuclease [Flavobacterium sp. NRK F10]